ncbi:MAG: hypothetical protein KGL39_33815 [Patescibacteria group bacterium]|nr:hypothetical protein [Patescibacteria group bacterium]
MTRTVNNGMDLHDARRIAFILSCIADRNDALFLESIFHAKDSLIAELEAQLAQQARSLANYAIAHGWCHE